MTREEIATEIEAPLAELPPHLQEGLRDYLVARQPVGGFLKALLSNDLEQAVLRADPVSFLALRELVVFLTNFAPANAFGSPDRVRQWLQGGS